MKKKRNEILSPWLFALGALVSYNTHLSTATDPRLPLGVPIKKQNCYNCQQAGHSADKHVEAFNRIGGNAKALIEQSMNAVKGPGPGRFRHITDQGSPTYNWQKAPEHKGMPTSVAASTKKVLGDLSWWENSYSSKLNPNFVAPSGWQNQFYGMGYF